MIFYKVNHQKLMENNTWLKLFSKQCPKCQWHIQKTEGCDHMTCRHCKHEFCWICRVDYKLIADKGNSQHETSCTHYEVIRFTFYLEY